MSKLQIILLLIIVLGLGLIFTKGYWSEPLADFIVSFESNKNMINIGDMKILKITSVAFEEGGKIPSKYTCDGENINPPFKIENIPPEAKSLALIADDPDAPSGVWVHWTVWNIDPNINKITEGNVPKGAIEGQTSFGNSGYGGPCPPSGSHHYLFKFYALDTKLDLPVETNNDELEGFIRNHLIASGGLTGIYERD